MWFIQWFSLAKRNDIIPCNCCFGLNHFFFYLLLCSSLKWKGRAVKQDMTVAVNDGEQHDTEFQGPDRVKVVTFVQVILKALECLNPGFADLVQ